MRRVGWGPAMPHAAPRESRSAARARARVCACARARRHQVDGRLLVHDAHVELVAVVAHAARLAD
eukprot:5498391-Prymnesium_polylepis.1